MVAPRGTEQHALPCHAVRGFWARSRGLLGHPPPAPGTGWWFDNCQAVHTVGMRYPIDVVFVSAAGRILRIVPALGPGRACWQRGAVHVVELAAGQARHLDLRAGDEVLFC
ncbi:DUF192 domain-containing protein [Achromobacter sp. GG226]|uniref:DUF192 domain-containing protein n=1 Tax=Verticiella alkaliphila TaxID=2779529 RepID=UPI001C0C3F74|nr:DUF192 domain-containing protein [Verticiella sp. GG226]MBU4610119.1 DUF192 domain-containing protein [Verticiella sp. GG226]